MNADVLLLGVKNDDCWPSDIAVPRIAETLKKCNYPHKVEAYVYEKGSHALTDGLEAMSGFARFALKNMVMAEKNIQKSVRKRAKTVLKGY